jgi:hypothetical protein
MIGRLNVCNDQTFRRNVLASLTSDPDVIDELLAYNENHFGLPGFATAEFPLEDEPFIEPWKIYAQQVEEHGSIALLGRYLMQLNFPVEAGISERPDYLKATRSGIWPSDPQGIKWDCPEKSSVVIHPTSAGHIPVVTLGSRQDFETMIRALGKRNEPVAIPASLGASMIANYTNWHRVRLLRERFESSPGAGIDWSAEFARIKANKSLYQDRFIVVSMGPYSGVAAASLGMDDESWSLISASIRREHECVHYFTKRVFGSMRNNLLDEVLADYFGIIGAVGRFRSDWFLHFFGLENYPAFRRTGRLQNYRGTPPLSDRAFVVLQETLYRATIQLADFDEFCRHLGNDLNKTIAFFALGRMSMEELASDHGASRLRDAFRFWQDTWQLR